MTDDTVCSLNDKGLSLSPNLDITVNLPLYLCLCVALCCVLWSVVGREHIRLSACCLNSSIITIFFVGKRKEE